MVKDAIFFLLNESFLGCRFTENAAFYLSGRRWMSAKVKNVSVKKKRKKKERKRKKKRERKKNWRSKMEVKKRVKKKKKMKQI